MSNLTYKEMLDYPTFFDDCHATTLREYFHELLSTLWQEGEGFSGKRPFGNSGWEYDIYKALVEMKAIKGKFGYDDEGNFSELLSFDQKEANKLIPKLIAEVCGL